MKNAFEKLWTEFFFEECTAIDTEEERELIKKTAEIHEKVNALFTDEQSATIERYIETLYEMQSAFIKKAFLKGVAFAAAILLAAGTLGTS